MTNRLLALLLVAALGGCASYAVSNAPESLKQVQLRKSEGGGMTGLLSGKGSTCTLQTIGLSLLEMGYFLPQYEEYCNTKRD